MIGTRKIKILAVSLAAMSAFAVLPASGVSAFTDRPEGQAACADLTGELTSVIGEVTAALTPQVTIPPTLPDVGKATAVVGKLAGLATNLVNLGCLPDPTKLAPVPLPVAEGTDAPALPAVPACAAPAAGLLSQIFGLLQNLLKALGGGLPDIPALLGQVTGLTGTVTGLTSSVGGATSCLPVPLPAPVNR
ncbi:hypothetical protein Lfu02_07480 [Longispora fulva]|uniref:Secreted protein n=1 Tax=Longispora fulva TaxID=619741 RepID=A0A8J7KJE4_9ACTN|nr:hypothetical protein [Longispora fulva]MBG6135381.1 hypothetical protein [Longispora fulva]GIG56376.1 hypothetical protein Lfu02_07480 [Longispora fulva]